MKVSVLIITYNHEKFIAQAIDSVLMQEVNFDYELVIGEDCSKDSTRDIVIDFQKRYPDKIRLLLPDRNLGGDRNFVQTLQACQGEYIALLEGDDYWTSPHKLQKQVDFLDNHPECAISYHNATFFYEDGRREQWNHLPPNQKEISTLEDLLVVNFIPTCSVMFRRGLFGEFPDWYHTLPMGDWALHVLNAQHGKIGYIGEVMSARRLHPGGEWSSLCYAQQLQGYIQFLETINVYLNFKYEQKIRTVVSEYWDELIMLLKEEAVQQSSVQAAVRNIQEQFNHWPSGVPLSNTRKAQILSKIYAHFGFASYNVRNFPVTRYCWVRTIRYDPSWLRNQGMWSIGLEIFLGTRMANWLRQVT